MFSPPFGLPMQHGDGQRFEQSIQAPPITRQIIDLSGWDPTNTINPVDVANMLLGQYSGSIRHFWLAQRQNLALGVAQQQGAAIQWPGISARYQSNQRTEMLTITVYPAAVVPQPTTQPNQTGGTFTISVPFTYWPIAGWYASAAGTQGFMTGPLYDSPINPYFPDPCFTPSGGNAVNGLSPSVADLNSASIWPTVAGNPVYSGGISWYNNNLPNIGGGFTSGWWLPNLAQTGFCVTKLTAQQYWEVEIVTLPADSPPDIPLQLPYGAVGDTLTSPVLTITNDSLTWSFPSSLNTFFTPTIGVICADNIDPSWKKNTQTYGGVINLDMLPSGRSVGVTRTSVLSGAATRTTWTPDEYYIYDLGDSGADGPGGPGDPSNPTIPDYGWSVNDVVGVGGDTLWQCTIAGIGPSIGPAGAGSTRGTTLGCGSATFLCIADSQPVTGLPGAFTNVSRVVPGSSSSTNLWQSLWGDVFQSDDAFDGSGDLIASGLNAPGVHTPVIMGRLDAVNSVFSPSQTVPYGTTGAHGQAADGVYTGVDLNGMKAGDIIMVAVSVTTDPAKQSMIWFGKNGKWYDTNGVSTFAPGSPHLQAAAILDSGTHFYPACSVRLGPTKLTMRFGAGLKYTPPGGFKPYSS